jgi:hypothetical protein
MECHHIVPRSDGGEDSYENCIPLCFDCHAEVGHYNPEHPKGIKFTPEELRGHRDRWYKAIETGNFPGIPSNYNELDCNLFKKICDILGGSHSMTHFKDHDYAASFNPVIVERIWNLYNLVQFPETEFCDTQVAEIFSDLVSAVSAYIKNSSGRVYKDGEIAHIPPEWESSDKKYMRDKFDEAVEVMNKVAQDVWNAYVQFVKIGRVRLNLDISA